MASTLIARSGRENEWRVSEDVINRFLEVSRGKYTGISGVRNRISPNRRESNGSMKESNLTSKFLQSQDQYHWEAITLTDKVESKVL